MAAKEKKESQETSTPTPKTDSKKEQGLELEGIVVEAVKGAFRVQVVQPGEDIQKEDEGKGHIVLGHLAGKLRKFGIKVVPGDRVKIEVSPYDLNRGRITYRMK